MIKSWWNFWNTVGRLISCLMSCRNLPDTIFLQPWYFWITYVRTSKLSCLSRLLPVLFRRIRCTNTWFIPLYKLFLNAVRPHVTCSWIWVILPLFLWIAVFHRLRILIILLSSVFPELTDCASSFYQRGVVVIFSKKISNSSLSPIPNRSQWLSRTGF